jgi:hypothetical protein
MPGVPNQRQLMRHLLERGVSSRRGVMNAHLETGMTARVASCLDRSEAAQRCGFILPLPPAMPNDQIGLVTGTLLDAIGACDASSAQ